MLQHAFCIFLDQLVLNNSKIQDSLLTSQSSQQTARACELASVIFLQCCAQAA